MESPTVPNFIGRIRNAATNAVTNVLELPKDVLSSLTTNKEISEQKQTLTLNQQFASNDFQASQFIRSMFDASLDMDLNNNTNKNIKSKNKSFQRENRSIDVHSHNIKQPTTRQGTRDCVESIKDRTIKQLKQRITQKYHVFITAAQDTRELTELVRRQNEQVEKYETTLQILTHGPIHQHSNTHSNRHQSRTSTSTASSTDYTRKTSLLPIYGENDSNDEDDDVDIPSKKRQMYGYAEDGFVVPDDASDNECSDGGNDSASFGMEQNNTEYAQLDVLIVQRRMEEATTEAKNIILNHRRQNPSTNKIMKLLGTKSKSRTNVYVENAEHTSEKKWLSLNRRLDQLNALLLHALEHVPLHDHKRQLKLVAMMSSILRATSGCQKLLILRSQLITRNVRNIIVRSVNTSMSISMRSKTDPVDDPGLQYVSNICHGILNVAKSTFNDFQSAFSSNIEWTNILCSLIAWMKRDCIDCIVRMLGYGGSFNSLVGKHQIHTKEMYLYPLSSAIARAATATADDTSTSSSTSSTSYDSATSYDMLYILKNGCNVTALYDSSRFASLLALIQVAIHECQATSVETGVPISSCIKKKLIYEYLNPSIAEHCISFLNFIRVSSGCGIDVGFAGFTSFQHQTESGHTGTVFHTSKMEILCSNDVTIDVSQILIATAESLQKGVVSFLNAMKTKTIQQKSNESNESNRSNESKKSKKPKKPKERKKKKFHSTESVTEDQNYWDELIGPKCHVHMNVSNTCRWFVLMIMHQSHLLNSLQITNVLDSLQIYLKDAIEKMLLNELNHLDVQNQHSSVRIAFGTFQVELNNCIAQLQKKIHVEVQLEEIKDGNESSSSSNGSEGWL